MTKSKHIPKRRFKEFELDGAWEQESLGEIVDFSIKTNSLSREKLSLESYEVQNIHYGDVLIKFDNVLDLQRDSLPSIIDSKVLDFKESLLQDGDLIFADAAEDSTVGKAIEVRNIGGKNIVSGLHTIAARPTQLFAPFYLGYYINSNFYHDQILPLMQGTKVSSISKSNLQVTKITFPTIDEQKELGKFFQTIDSLITLHQHKLDKLKNLKKSYLSELFPEEGERVPKRRFPGFEGEWEQRKLGEILVTVPYKKFMKEPESSGRFEVIQQGYDSIIGFADGFPCNEFEDVVIFGDHTLSLYKPQKPFFVGTDGVRILKGKSTIVGYYLYALLERYKPKTEGYKRYYGILTNVEVAITNNPIEQNKIASLFQKLDESISLQQQKLDKLKDLKKAYLNELFV